MPKYKRWKPFSANLSIKCRKCWPRNPRYSGAIGNISVLLFYWSMSSLLLHLNMRNMEGEAQEVGQAHTNSYHDNVTNTHT